MLRRIAALLLTALFALCAAQASLAAEDITAGLDVIILLDSTNSMEDQGSNDPQRMRLDAAVMLINMCDAGSSSVAVVPFSNTAADTLRETGDYQWSIWRDITGESARTELCDYVMRLTTMNGNTDISSAFERAAALINARRLSGSTNKTVVLLLTDGDNIRQDGRTKEQIDADTIEYANAIRTGGAYIYSILLTRDANSSGSSGAAALLRQFSGSPEGLSDAYLWQNVQADQLKDRFSDAFADMIGSRRKQVPVRSAGGDIAIDIEVPNRSVTEVNVVLPLQLTSNANALNISRDGKSVSGSGTYVYTNNTSNDSMERYDFISVKLIKPEPGRWSFTLPQASSVDISSYTVDMLYNYELLLTSALESEEILYYSDALEIEARFVDTNGRPSTDDKLYRLTDEMSGTPAIPATLSISRGNTAVYTDTMLSLSAELRYYTLLDLDALRSTFAPGDYTIDIHAEGDELYRTADPLSFTISNRSPYVSAQAPDMTFRIDNCFGDDTGMLQYTLSDYFTDPDGDALTYSYEITGGAEKLSTASIADGVLSVLPLSGTEGSASILVTATDTSGETAQMTIGVSITSIKNLIASGAVRGSLQIAPGAHVEKGGTARIVLQYDMSGVPDGLFTLDDIKQHANVTFALNGVPVAALVDQDDADYCTVSFGNTAASYSIEGTSVLDGIPLVDTGLTIDVKNRAPYVKAEAGAFDAELAIDTDPTFSIDLTQVFADDDLINAGGDILTYTAEFTPVSEDSGWDAPALAALRLVGLKPKEYALPEAVGGGVSPNYTLTLNDTGVAECLLTVTDADGASASYALRLTGASQKERLMTYGVYGLAALILIIIAAIIYNKRVVHQAWPRTGMTGSLLSCYRDGMPISVGGKYMWSLGRNGRGKLTIADLYKEQLQYSGNPGNINDTIRDELKKIIIWPTKGNAFVVELPKKEKLNVTSIALDGVDLRKAKKGKWKLGSMLTIELNANGGNCKLEWKRERSGESRGTQY